MADERGPVVWGLWNQRLTEWFNPGGRAPYFRTQAEAMRWIPVALRQYPMGKWEVREYPREDVDQPSQAGAGGGEPVTQAP